MVVVVVLSVASAQSVAMVGVASSVVAVAPYELVSAGSSADSPSSERAPFETPPSHSGSALR